MRMYCKRAPSCQLCLIVFKTCKVSKILRLYDLYAIKSTGVRVFVDNVVLRSLPIHVKNAVFLFDAKVIVTTEVAMYSNSDDGRRGKHEDFVSSEVFVIDCVCACARVKYIHYFF